jgi:uncharacterized protein YqfB (UPF0267 family)
MDQKGERLLIRIQSAKDANQNQILKKFRVTKRTVTTTEIDVMAHDDVEAEEIADLPANDDRWSFDEFDEVDVKEISTDDHEVRGKKK